MDKKDFIDAIFAMYPNSFSNRASAWRNAYEVALPDQLDYEKLFDWMLVNYTSTSQAPAPAFFKKFIKDYEISQIQREQLEQANKNRQEWEETERIIAQQMAEAEKALPEDYGIIEPLEVLKQCYSTPQNFIRSMIERQISNPCHKAKGNYIFFTKDELKTFEEYTREIKYEVAKSLFWRKVMALTGSNAKFNELCAELT